MTAKNYPASVQTRFQQRLMRVAPLGRDDWADQLLGIGDIPDDGNDLPRGYARVAAFNAVTLATFSTSSSRATAEGWG